MNHPFVARTPQQLATHLPADPTKPRVVVMTMGALHEGHLALVTRARELAGTTGQVIVTIYVNPLQFGPNEDFASYPRDLEGDLALLCDKGVDAVFAPDDATMYPEGTPRLWVRTGELGQVFEGAARPGHFDGVATVVLKLLHITAPTDAIFGQKDAQQLLLLRRMVRDFDVPVQLHAVKIVREPDGLAKSSRNAYLNPTQRQEATVIHRALSAAAACGQEGGSVAEVLQAARDQFARVPNVVVDYLELVDPVTVEIGNPQFSGTALALVAARVGSTRLLDNMSVTVNNPGGNR